ncbi:MAG TPA: bifunctional [glutamine synthetase] adenylyltransferase/[glutamine synthetase]-adenylyl-L-tyrosine phosphorylase [Trebonia sp.]|nr:bifunctional [glutamine synthetase] adenylyltransferase/[glutamine synthetase]-adenylyl-L-tyrosine phosphorylase [Trebonia sp.]
MGFADVPRAVAILTQLQAVADASGPVHDDGLLVALGTASDPDLALVSLARLAERDRRLLPELRADGGLRDRLIVVLGASTALADHLARHPADLAVLRGQPGRDRPSRARIRAELLRAVGADPGLSEPVAAPSPDQGRHPVALAGTYHRRLLHLAAGDLTGDAAVDEVAEELADLADGVLEAALAVARSELAPGTEFPRLAVIAMGKCGARELNYASDVDVVLVASDDTGQAGLKAATQLAARMLGVCGQFTPEGMIFPVDPNLRPEGRNGPLVRTLASHLAYYDRWAKTWEFQALLKARPAAGDVTLGKAYADAVTPLVWQASRRDNFVQDVQAMRRRVESALPKNTAGRELKLGPGGLRDIEFAVQLLQLVHGRADERVRAPGTLPALAALAAGGYVGREDTEDLAAAYRFLRQTEHLLQLYHLRRTHALPDDPAVLRRLGRAMHLLSDAERAGPGPAEGLSAPAGGRPPASQVPPAGAAPPPGRGDPADAFDEAWRKHAMRVRRLHEKLFYRPLLDAVARLPTEAARLTPEAAKARLEALGYADPAGALRHIEALTTGVRRRAAIQRTLLPVLLGWFADAAEPDAGLLAFRQVSEALGESPWYLRLLRDETKAAQRMACVLASSRYATGLLLRAPDAVAIFADDEELVPRPFATVRTEMMAAATRHESDPDQAAVAIRSIRRRELLRIAAADVLEMTSLTDVGEALTAVTDAALEAALAVAVAGVERGLGRRLPTRFAVMAMGRYGGHETGYGSDADVIFVHDPQAGLDAAAERAASDAAQAVAAEMRRLLELPAPDPPLVLDASLRPEGRQGPLVRSLAACRKYYAGRSAPWEYQALLRAEFTAGDASLGADFIALADEYRYPASGLSDHAAREIRRIKARVEAERIPRGVERARHLKLGPGGLSDVEWTVQLLQLKHGAVVPGLRTTKTLQALDAAVGAGLVPMADGAALAESWQLAARIRNAIMLVRGRADDSLPSRHAELTAVARLLGYRPAGTARDSDGRAGPGNVETVEPAQALEDDYRRTARHARAVMERLFFG